MSASAGKSKAKRSSSAASGKQPNPSAKKRGYDPTHVVVTAAADAPPHPLDQQKYTPDELFEYYAVRGNLELQQSDAAVRHIEAAPPPQQQQQQQERSAFGGEENEGSPTTTTAAAATATSTRVKAIPAATTQLPRLRDSYQNDYANEIIQHQKQQEAEAEQRRAMERQQLILDNRSDNINYSNNAINGTTGGGAGGAPKNRNDFYASRYYPENAKTTKDMQKLWAEENNKDRAFQQQVAQRQQQQLSSNVNNVVLNNIMQQQQLHKRSSGGKNVNSNPANTTMMLNRSMGTVGANTKRRSSGLVQENNGSTSVLQPIQRRRSSTMPTNPQQQSPNKTNNGHKVSITMNSSPTKRGGGGSVNQLDALQLYEQKEAVEQELVDAFVYSFLFSHPEEAQKLKDRQEAAQRRSSSIAAKELMAATSGGGGGDGDAKKKSKKKKASVAAAADTGKGKKKRPTPEEGAPPANLKFFINSLLAIADAEGLVTLEQVLQVLSETPFAIRHEVAIRTLFQQVRLVSEAKQQQQQQFQNQNFPGATVTIGSPHSPLHHHSSAGAAAAGGNGGNETSLYMGTSTTVAGDGSRAAAVGRRKVGVSGVLPAPTTMNSTMATVRHPASPNTTMGHPLTVQVQGGGGGGNNNNNNNNNNASVNNINVNAAMVYTPRVYVRELVGALDALLNSEETAAVARWVSFVAYAMAAENDSGSGHHHHKDVYTHASAAGVGHIPKSVLDHVKQHKRGLNEAQCHFSAAMMKALHDAFAIIAKEEEENYLKQQTKGKGKRRSTTTSSAGGGSSVIPANVMRISHMDFATFTRLFDALPQLPAACARVWLPLLMCGEVIEGENRSSSEDDDDDDNDHNNHQDEDEHEEEDGKHRHHHRHRSSSAHSSEADSEDGAKSGAHPLSQLGAELQRMAIVQRLIQDRLGCMRKGLQDRGGGGGGGANINNNFSIADETSPTAGGEAPAAPVERGGGPDTSTSLGAGMI